MRRESTTTLVARLVSRDILGASGPLSKDDLGLLNRDDLPTSGKGALHTRVCRTHGH